MITKQLLKTEIDKVPTEYLDILYKIIKIFEIPSITEFIEPVVSKNTIKNDCKLNWHEFIKETYGCLADDPIERGTQSKYEIREIIE
ncbi:hypothetical protein L0128_02190 [candidate division KSB1 bacterium]|nr:hypothetical protein [candidate division KSB1 bacterium]